MYINGKRRLYPEVAEIGPWSTKAAGARFLATIIMLIVIIASLYCVTNPLHS